MKNVKGSTLGKENVWWLTSWWFSIEHIRMKAFTTINQGIGNRKRNPLGPREFKNFTIVYISLFKSSVLVLCKGYIVLQKIWTTFSFLSNSLRMFQEFQNEKKCYPWSAGNASLYVVTFFILQKMTFSIIQTLTIGIWAKENYVLATFLRKRASVHGMFEMLSIHSIPPLLSIPLIIAKYPMVEVYAISRFEPLQVLSLNLSKLLEEFLFNFFHTIPENELQWNSNVVS